MADPIDKLITAPGTPPNGGCSSFEELEDPFAPENLAITGDMFPTHVTLTPELGKIAIGRPGNFDFVRVRPGADYRLPAWLLINRDAAKRDRTHYLFGKTAAAEAQLNPALAPMMRQAMLYLCVSRSGNLRIWPVRLATDDWAISELECAEAATKNWVRVVTAETSFHRVTASGTLADPTWPAETFSELLRRAFGQELMIATLAHPVISNLLGAD